MANTEQPEVNANANRRIVRVAVCVGLILAAIFTAIIVFASNDQGKGLPPAVNKTSGQVRKPLPLPVPVYECEGDLTVGFLGGNPYPTTRAMIEDPKWIVAGEASPSTADYCNSIQGMIIQTGRPDVARDWVRILPGDDAYKANFSTTVYYYMPNEVPKPVNTQFAHPYQIKPHTEVHTFSLAQAKAGQAVINTEGKIVVGIEFGVEGLPPFGQPLYPSCMKDVPVNLGICASPKYMDTYAKLPPQIVRLPNNWCITNRQLEGASC